MNKTKFVNGPINAVRLEGNIGSVNKKIYLFMDTHEVVQHQTECDDIRSKDIDKFLVDTFDKAEEMKKNIMYDFFVETNPLYSIRFGHPNYKGRYLFEQTEKLVSKSMNIDSDKVQKSNEFNNVRFHYADIREYSTRATDNIINVISDLTSRISHSGLIFYDDVLQILDGIKIISSNISFLYDLIYNNKDIKNPKQKLFFTKDQEILAKYSEQDYKELSEKVIYKILRSYSHADVAQIIKEIINTELHIYFKIFFDKIGEMQSFLNQLLPILEPFKNQNIRNKLVKQPDGTYLYGLSNDIYTYLDSFYTIFFDITAANLGVQLMDIYALRRMLDKDYIHNVVVYTGAAHSVNYIRLLVKYFDFKITNWSYLKDDDLKKAEKIIKDSKNPEELNVLFFAPELKQCSDLTKFPDLLQ